MSPSDPGCLHSLLPAQPLNPPALVKSNELQVPLRIVLYSALCWWLFQELWLERTSSMAASSSSSSSSSGGSGGGGGGGGSSHSSSSATGDWVAAITVPCHGLLTLMNFYWTYLIAKHIVAKRKAAAAVGAAAGAVGEVANGMERSKQL